MNRRLSCIRDPPSVPLVAGYDVFELYERQLPHSPQGHHNHYKMPPVPRFDPYIGLPLTIMIMPIFKGMVVLEGEP